jgi:endonuclease YncB( thermonuclease family)
MSRLACVVLLWLLATAGSVCARTEAWVSWVMDGDTVLLLPAGEHEPVKWRIGGIDAPESCQPGGEASRDALVALVLRRTVQIEVLGQDTYGRQLGKLWLGEVDVGAEMVRNGHAWAYHFRSGRGPYAPLQREAQKAKRGLFADRETAMSPGVFRQFHGSCHATHEDQAPVVRVPQTGQAGSR